MEAKRPLGLLTIRKPNTRELETFSIFTHFQNGINYRTGHRRGRELGGSQGERIQNADGIHREGGDGRSEIHRPS